MVSQLFGSSQRILGRLHSFGGCFAVIAALEGTLPPMLLWSCHYGRCFAAKRIMALPYLWILCRVVFLLRRILGRRSLISFLWMLCHRGFIILVGNLCINVYFLAGPVG
jgi:uncharacterized MAPEG superfamily protein